MAKKLSDAEGHRWRCWKGHFFDVTAIVYEEDGRGKKTPVEVCPECGAVNITELEKVVSYVKTTSIPQKEFVKLNTDQFNGLISRLSNLDKLIAIKLISKQYKEKAGDIDSLDDLLWHIIENKQRKRKF